MTASQVPLSPPAERHRNQQLFSDYFLNSILPRRPAWEWQTEAAEPVMRAIAEIFSAFTPSANEAQTENELVRPVLEVLGHTFEVQAPLATPYGTKRPDYILYRDRAALVANKDKVLDETLLSPGAFAVGDAKAWDRSLDRALKGAGDRFDNRNPSDQIAFYVQHGGVEWGVLTNGRLWRLVHKDTAHKLDRFYEVDLPALLATGDPAAFLYFYRFFHRSAFEPQPLGVAALRRESIDFARGVGKTLKFQVFDALRHVAQGFLDYPDNALRPDPATVKAIYDHALIVLYRMLFILYAEARGLLPLRESQLYRQEYSLYAVTREVAGRVSSSTHLLPTSARLWARLQELFGIINLGSPPLEVASFDGGLFDPTHHPFLERYSVGDAHLEQAIDRLARVDGQFIDYRDLAEQHLGTIYEGLLEYHIEALTPPEAEWSIALVNDKGERKITGSYYTPANVVKYIVDQAVGPVLHAAVTDKEREADKIAAVLEVNVVDPSMGSGHFLVEAIDYIARFLVNLGLTPDIDAHGEADIAYWRRRVAQSCVYGVDLNPLAVDLAKLSVWLITAARDRPLSFLDHHLRCGNALVGTRISDLRLGEPAQASRKKGRQAVAAGQLSMLDDDAFRRSMSTAVDSMWLIESTAGNTVQEVKEQERIYDQLRETLVRKYATLADLATATTFGVDVDPALWRPLADYATGRTLAAPPQFNEWLGAAAAVAARHRFFHWELEFPEVFFDRFGQPLGEQAGFDTVVGNPPYVRQEALGPLKSYFAAAFPETYHGVADLYVYFYHQGLRLLREGGRLSYIVTNKWMRSGYGEPLRAYFASQAALEQIIDFGHAPIFAEADVFPSILVLDKPRERGGDQSEDGLVQVTSFPREVLGSVTLEHYVREHGHMVSRRRFGRAPWSLEPSEVDDLMAKIRRAGVPLVEYGGKRPLAGIKTGLNDAYLISSTLREHLIHAHPGLVTHIKPYLRGRDIKRWSPLWEDLWIILLKSSGDHHWTWKGLPSDQAEVLFQSIYPALHEHMKTWKVRLMQRSDQGHYWWELRSCAYYDVFDGTNIFYQDLAFHSRFGLGIPDMVAEMTCFCFPMADSWLLSVLNSPLMWAYMWRRVIHGKDEVLRLKTIYMERLPIAPPTDAIRSETEPAVERLIAITKANQKAVRDVLAWLRTEFGVEVPGQKLEDFAALDVDVFVEQVRKRRPRAAGRLTPAGLSDLRAGFVEQATPVRQLRAEATGLERRLADLVNVSYGLTPDEVDLLWRTAPPRMPG